MSFILPPSPHCDVSLLAADEPDALGTVVFTHQSHSNDSSPSPVHEPQRNGVLALDSPMICKKVARVFHDVITVE